MTVEELKVRLPLPELLVRLALFDYVPSVGTHRCPLHREKQGASFSLFRKAQGWGWKCHGACGVGGDEVSLLAMVQSCTRREAIPRYHALLNGPHPLGACPHSTHATSMRPRLEMQRQVAFPEDLGPGSRADLETVAALRQVDFWAVATMQQAGVLAFGTVRGERCWVVLDESRRCAEARRLNGTCFPGSGKVHTLRGSDKSWPVGLQLPRDRTRFFRHFLLVEGSGDLVAAYHWALLLGPNCLPIALLGAGMKRIHPEALELLRGASVRIVPHDDPAGRSAVDAWQLQLRRVGCTVYIFRMHDITLPDGRRGKDLNDTTALSADVAGKLEGLFSWK
ncbi:MAG: zinc finger protein [Verrucomicrobiota bacterium]